MPLILRSVKGSKLNTAEMDGNLLYLVSTLSASLIQVTGSSISAPNTSITGAYFSGNGAALTSITASFVTASNVYGPYGTSSIASASFAISASRSSTSSYALNINPIITGALNLSGSLSINGVLVATTLQVGGNTVSGTPAGSDTYIQFNSGGFFQGDASFRFNYDTTYSFEQGSGVSTLKGQWTTVHGLATRASSSYQLVAGQYNTYSPYDSAFIVGGGYTIPGFGPPTIVRKNIIHAWTDGSGNGTVEITGSLNINDLLVLTPRTSTPSGVPTGSIIASGSAGNVKPYFFDGTNWNALY